MGYILNKISKTVNYSTLQDPLLYNIIVSFFFNKTEIYLNYIYSLY